MRDDETPTDLESYDIINEGDIKAENLPPKRLWPAQPDAIAQGCNCPEQHNINVDYKNGWYVMYDCPLHGLEKGSVN